jgi:ferredoxin
MNLLSLIVVGALAMGASAATYEYKDTQLLVDDGVCRLINKDYHATFDLTELAKSKSYFEAKDAITHRNHKYAWALCGKLDMAEFAKDHDDICKDDVDKEPSSVQFDATSDNEDVKCVVTGQFDPEAISFLTEDENIVGLSFNYSTGDLTDNGVVRTLTLNYRCLQTAEDEIGEVSEVSEGQYSVDINSVHACPTQCISSYATGTLCSGHGRCAVDKTAKKARCYCNTGFSGSVCDGKASADDSSPTSVLIGLDITLLLVLVCLSGVIIWKMQTLKEDSEDQTYARMNDDEEAPAPRMGGDDNSINNVAAMPHPRSRSSRLAGDDLADLEPIN